MSVGRSSVQHGGGGTVPTSHILDQIAKFFILLSGAAGVLVHEDADNSNDKATIDADGEDGERRLCQESYQQSAHWSDRGEDVTTMNDDDDVC